MVIDGLVRFAVWLWWAFIATVGHEISDAFRARSFNSDAQLANAARAAVARGDIPAWAFASRYVDRDVERLIYQPNNDRRAN